MKILIMLCALVAGGWLLWGLMHGTSQKRGLHQGALVSNGRPAMAVMPAPGMRLMGSGWCSIAPFTRQSLDGSARLYYSLYNNDRAVLVVSLAEAENNWLWPHGNGTTYTFFRTNTWEHKEHTFQEGTMILKADQDPFRNMTPLAGTSADADARPDITSPRLTHRMSLLFNLRKLQLIVEYSELIPLGPIPVQDDVPYVAAFEQRAREAFTLLHKNSGDTIPTEITPLPKAPQSLPRRILAKWTGEMYRQGE